VGEVLPKRKWPHVVSVEMADVVFDSGVGHLMEKLCPAFGSERGKGPPVFGLFFMRRKSRWPPTSSIFGKLRRGKFFLPPRPSRP